MTLQSMTGFARLDGRSGRYQWAWELRSVNGKGLDILAGYGVTVEYDMQRYFRDSRQCTFSPISNEMSRNMIMQFQGFPKSWP